VLAKPGAPNNKDIARYEARERRTLARTLDRELEPRVRPGRRGRPKGSRNCLWPPDIDKSLIELSGRCSPSVVKKMIVKLLLNPGSGSRGVQLKPDSLRKKIERRMDTLKLPTGTARKKQDKTAKPWTEQQTQTLLGMVGNDLTDKTIVERTEHTIKAARAKLRLLGYAASELRSVAYTVEELAEKLQVTARKIRRWKERSAEDYQVPHQRTQPARVYQGASRPDPLQPAGLVQARLAHGLRLSGARGSRVPRGNEVHPGKCGRAKKAQGRPRRSSESHPCPGIACRRAELDIFKAGETRLRRSTMETGARQAAYRVQSTHRRRFAVLFRAGEGPRADARMRMTHLRHPFATLQNQATASGTPSTRQSDNHWHNFP
jgi:hypothetical protein